DVVGRRQERVEIAAAQRLLLRDLELGACRITSIVQSPIHRLVLPALIDAHEAPCQMVVHWCRSPHWNDKGKQTQRSILGSIQRVLSDASTHPALIVGTTARGGQPSIGREQRREGWLQGLDTRRGIRHLGREMTGFGDERADLLSIDEKAETAAIVM